MKYDVHMLLRKMKCGGPGRAAVPVSIMMEDLVMIPASHVNEA